LLELIQTKLERFNRIKNNQNNLYIGEKIFLHEINTSINGKRLYWSTDR
jgi:two-component system sensor kinase